MSVLMNKILILRMSYPSLPKKSYQITKVNFNFKMTQTGRKTKPNKTRKLTL